MLNTITVSSPKGPRFSKLKYTHKISTKELFESFKKNYPEYKIELKEFENIWLDVLAPKIQEEAALNPLGIKLPFYVGELKLQWLPYRPKEIDYNQKDKGHQIVPLIDLRNGGKVSKLKWERRNAVRYNRWLQFYGFTPSREIEKLKKKKIEENPNDLRVSRITLGGAKIRTVPFKKIKMITKRQAITQLRKKLEEQNADTGKSNQFLYYSLLEQAKWIVKREIRAGKVYKNMSLFKPLKCIRVVESSVIERGCPIQIPCNIWRTDKKLPDTWQDDYGPVIKYAMSVDDSTRWHLISKEEWNNKRTSPYAKYDKTKYMIFSDGYLWFPNENPRRVNVYGYWIDDPILNSECGDKPSCAKYLDTPFEIPEWTEAEIVNKAFEILLKGTKQIPIDEQIDKNEMRKS